MQETHLIEHARRAQAVLSEQIAALERIAADKASHPGERYWAVQQALRSADTVHASLSAVHSQYVRVA